LESSTYFDRLSRSVTRIARHSYYPGKEDAVEQCLEEVEHLRDSERVTQEQFLALREILLGEEASCLLDGVAREFDHAKDPPHAGGIAILCQGAGSQAAFSAGVLQGLLDPSIQPRRISALGGSSFGAVCALLAWDGLLRGDRRRGVEQIESFWQAYSAHSLVDTLLNYSSQMVHHLRALVSLQGSGPPAILCLDHDLLRDLLERQIDFGVIRALARIEGAPELVVSREGPAGDPGCVHGPDIRIDDLLGSAPVPCPRTRAPAMAPASADLGADGGRGSTIRKLARLKPAEIWLIQINQAGHHREPSPPADLAMRFQWIEDQILALEIGFIEKINSLLERGALIGRYYRRIDVHRIVMEHDLDEASKHDRSPSFIGPLMSYGRERARQFLEKRRAVLSRQSAALPADNHNVPGMPASR
jgi:NTE family protein